MLGERALKIPLLLASSFSASGVLVFRSGFPPRILGVRLIAMGFVCLADGVTPLLFPSYANVVGRFSSVALTLGKPAMMLWLLITCANDKPLEPRQRVKRKPPRRWAAWRRLKARELKLPS